MKALPHPPLLPRSLITPDIYVVCENTVDNLNTEITVGAEAV